MIDGSVLLSSEVVDHGFEKCELRHVDVLRPSFAKAEAPEASSADAVQSTPVLPPPASGQVYCTVGALDTGTLSLPERDFLQGGDPVQGFIAPSMSFVVTHPTPGGKHERLVFDLGLRRTPSRYGKELEAHVNTRQPFQVPNEARDCLRRGGLEPDDIDTIVLSHVHWDHIGEPSHYARAQFVLGAGSLDLLDNNGPASNGIVGHFEADLVDRTRTRELPFPIFQDPARFPRAYATSNKPLRTARVVTDHEWRPIGPFPNAVDFYGDGSLYLVDSPGHLLGHLNALVRLSATRWVYLGGDVCHHPELLRGSRKIATWHTPKGCGCVHADLGATEEMLSRIRQLAHVEGATVEIILAHDFEWRSQNTHRFFPVCL